MTSPSRRDSLAQSIAEHPGFFDEIRDRTHFVFPDTRHRFPDGLSGESLRELAFTSNLHHPDLCMTKDGPTPSEAYVFPSGLVDVVAVSRLLREGHSIVLQRLHERSHVLATLTREFETVLGCNAQSNIYISPAGAAALPTHFDSHDVFVLQLSGSKMWEIHAGAMVLPTADDSFDPSEPVIGEPLERRALSEGDVLYIPRGIPHRAVALDQESIHVTVGVFWPTYGDLAADLLRHLMPRVEQLRRSLPPHAASQRDRGASILCALTSALDVDLSDLDEVLDSHRREFSITRQPLAVDIDEQLRRLSSPTDTLCVRARWPMSWHLEATSDEVTISCSGRRHCYAKHHESALRTIFDESTLGRPIAIRELETTERIDLLERLASEGMIEVMPDSEPVARSPMPTIARHPTLP